MGTFYPHPFTSFHVLAGQYWQTPTSTGHPSIWDRLSQNKVPLARCLVINLPALIHAAVQTPIVEPREKHEFIAAMHVFYSKVRDPTLSGAIFFAVCRGKVKKETCNLKRTPVLANNGFQCPPFLLYRSAKGWILPTTTVAPLSLRGCRIRR